MYSRNNYSESLRNRWRSRYVPMARKVKITFNILTINHILCSKKLAQPSSFSQCLALY